MRTPFTVFDAGCAAGDGSHDLLAHRVSAALTPAAGFLALALLVTLMPAHGGPSLDDVRPTSDLAVDADTPVRAPA